VPKSKPAKGYRVFFSHAHKDRWIARQCVRLIEEECRGAVQVFLDEKDIEGGESIAESVLTGIEECAEFVVLLTPYSRHRDWVLIEIGAALGLRKHVVAIVDKIAPNEAPDIMRQYKVIDLNQFDDYLDQLRNRAKDK
jgi:predicted nucleotide-binding protein